jgi:hypothetical protein
MLGSSRRFAIEVRMLVERRQQCERNSHSPGCGDNCLVGVQRIGLPSDPMQIKKLCYSGIAAFE